MQEYSAGAVKLPFWFAEFRRAVLFLESGQTAGELRRLAIEENFFAASTPLRGKQIYLTVCARAQSLPEALFSLFARAGLETQKLIALIAAMRTDALFFAFMREVYGEKLHTGAAVLGDADIRAFFLDKRRESEKVAGWTEATVQRLLACYKNYLAEAGLLKKGTGERSILRPLLDESLVQLLEVQGMGLILNCLR